MKNYKRSYIGSIHKICALSLLELTLTIAISAIILVSVAAVLAATIKVLQHVYTYNQQPDNSRIVLNIITNDLYINKGNFQITTTSNSSQLSFNLAESSYLGGVTGVNYTCDYITHDFSRNLIDSAPQLLLSNILNCDFLINNLSDRNPKVQIILNLTRSTPNLTNNIYEVINVPKST